MNYKIHQETNFKQKEIGAIVEDWKALILWRYLRN